MMALCAAKEKGEAPDLPLPSTNPCPMMQMNQYLNHPQLQLEDSSLAPVLDSILELMQQLSPSAQSRHDGEE